MHAAKASTPGGPDGSNRHTLRWRAEDLARLGEGPVEYAPVISEAEIHLASDSLDVWDAWPMADAQGNPCSWRGGELWFALAAPRSADPEQRHHLARIHHFRRCGDRFEHLGETLPEGLSPGSRLWSGSALCELGKVTLFFTAAGRRGEAAATFHQRIFAASADLLSSDEQIFGDWSTPREILRADGVLYRPADQDVGEPGKIKAFRDPACFRHDDGTDYLLFTGSSAERPGTHDGVIGIARADETGDYRLLPPLITATGVNNELERPHIVRSDGRLYLFWSTQRGVFAPEITAPTGLYGATAASLDGPWELLNDHGLVLANPPERPTQAYSWWVLPDLSVASFVDYWQPEDPAKSELVGRRERFGGTFAPFLHIDLHGKSARLVRG
ncbi:glycoside hydrolase family 68 protein [Allopontixanthobacter sp.]|uniref:glycoside hydrolase family 68 protein n=1 Tax=Allopontixanthobacter sp. TaxID=2906452 RepID=UPI002ABD0C79|nr:glycoside hydrolase family 68 protein [Allopontixanthobacter sp.]MDZ4308088.1 glycoside hydrolase family 68 protein [Allopontixanthobacter sp.]